MTVLAFDRYRSNADLIVAAVRLGYLREEWTTLDPTWGEGTFWRKWQPKVLHGTDLAAGKGKDGSGVDFTALPWETRSWDVVVFDGPYKLNGKPDPAFDERYGVHQRARWQDRMSLLEAGTIECARVADKMLLVKAQDQVSSGRVRWQTRILSDVAEAQGFDLIDMLHKAGGRAQPLGRRQVHARRNYSTLLVFERRSSTERTVT